MFWNRRLNVKLRKWFRKMPNLQEKYKLTPVEPRRVVGVEAYPFTIPSDHLVGIEVEVENVATNDLPRGTVWRVESDGSLRNNGMEFVSAPIRASEAPMALAQLLRDVLREACHFSPRTSVHVHLNVQDMEQSQLYDLVMLYAVYEKLFYRFAGRGRIRNIFCVPITDTKLMASMAECSAGTGWSKYTGLNLVPIRGDGDRGGYGTIEFRQMHGTFSIDKLCCWIDLITTLKEFVLKSSTKDIRQMILTMDREFDYHGLLQRIFGEKAAWLKYTGFEDVQETYLVAKSALCSSKVRGNLSATVSSDSPFYKFKG